MRKLDDYLHQDASHPVFLGREALRALLHRNRITFQHPTTWKESNDPDAEAKLEKIENVLEHHFKQAFAFDEFGPLSTRPRAGTGWATQTRPDRLPTTAPLVSGISTAATGSGTTPCGV